jgi:MerR family transcriptional regulator, light-induced transcriptional regulator
MKKDDPLTSAQYPMRVVVRRTGLSASVLRAWERRYGAVVPGRSEGGQRLYSEADIRKLTLLSQLVDAGHNISQVAGLDPEDLRRLLLRERRSVGMEGEFGLTEDVAEDEGDGRRADAPVPLPSDGRVEPYLERALATVHEMEIEQLESLLNRAAMTLGPATLVDELMVPLLNRIGLLWESGEVGPASEHVASTVVRRFLDWILEAMGGDGGAPVLMVGTPQGQRHEFGALLAAVVGAAEGCSVIQLGPDLPAEEIARAALQKGVHLVALSALHRADEDEVVEELQRLRAELPERVEVIVGGPAVEGYRKDLKARGIEVVEDLGAFRVHIQGRVREIRQNGSGRTRSSD